MPGDEYIKGKDKNELLADLIDTAHVGSQVHEQQKTAIMVRCTEDLESALKNLKYSIIESSKVSNVLSKRVVWLNIILTAATIIGAFATVWMAIH